MHEIDKVTVKAFIIFNVNAGFLIFYSLNNPEKSIMFPKPFLTLIKIIEHHCKMYQNRKQFF